MDVTSLFAGMAGIRTSANTRRFRRNVLPKPKPAASVWLGNAGTGSPSSVGSADSSLPEGAGEGR